MVLVGIGVAVWVGAIHVIGFVLGFSGSFGSLARVSLGWESSSVGPSWLVL